jgi:hopanoid biosynthesis associated protein HpnK
LIVHADDFGISESVNEGIVQAHRHGILTSTSLIASGVAFDHAVALAHATPTLDIGVHLTLVGEQPVSAGKLVPSLLQDNGGFYPDSGSFMRRYFSGAVSLEEIRRELDAQIRRVTSKGIAATHLDGHQHLHMVPAIRRVVGALAREHGIPAIRYPRESLQAYMLRDLTGVPRILQLLVLNLFCALASTGDARQPDRFVGFFYGGRLSKRNLVTVLRHLPATGTCELMCHPGAAAAESGHDHWGYQWRDERDALIDPEVRALLQHSGIELISYADLAQ